MKQSLPTREPATVRKRTANPRRTVFALHVIATCVRFPVLALLLIVEPIVRVALSGLALLCLGMAFFYEFLTDVPQFPFLSMAGLAVLCVLVLNAYYALLRVLR